MIPKFVSEIGYLDTDWIEEHDKFLNPDGSQNFARNGILWFRSNVRIRKALDQMAFIAISNPGKKYTIRDVSKLSQVGESILYHINRKYWIITRLKLINKEKYGNPITEHNVSSLRFQVTELKRSNDRLLKELAQKGIEELTFKREIIQLKEQVEILSRQLKRGNISYTNKDEI